MYSSIIPPIKERIPLNKNYELLSQNSPLLATNRQPKSINLNEARRIDHIPGEQIEESEKQSRENSFLKRSTSANAIMKIRSSDQPYNSSLSYYNKAIDYLKDQYKQTLDKLHQEVSELKAENQKLNFKLMVENEGSIDDIINDSLSKPLKNMRLKSNTSILTHASKNSASSSNISHDVLLNETIKDLKVKLKMSEDSNGHLNLTIRNLTKKLNLLKRLGENAQQLQSSDRVISSRSSSRSSSLVNQNHNVSDKTNSSETVNRSNHNDLRLGIQNTSISNSNIPKNASISLAVNHRKLQNQKENTKNQIKMGNLHFPVPPSPKEKPENIGKNLRGSNFTLASNKIKARSERSLFFGQRQMSGCNKYEKIIVEKDEIIDQLSQANSLQKNRIDDLESVLQQLQKKISVSENTQISNLAGDNSDNNNKTVRSKDSNTTILRSAASKQTLQLLPPISNNRFHSFVGSNGINGNGNVLINYEEANDE